MKHQVILEILKKTGEAVRNKVYTSLHQQSSEQLAAIYREGHEDTIYQIDKEVEDIIVPILEDYASQIGGLILIAEGINDGKELVLPLGSSPTDAEVKIIMDPIDGTRGIMYDKRSAFFLAGASANKADAGLQDLEVALLAELPTSRHYLADTLWAIKGEGAKRQTTNMLNGESKDSPVSPSTSASIYQGFGQIARFFPPGREILAAIEEQVIEEIMPDYEEGKTPVFEDQYISSGGQIYELLIGHDRYTADIRTALYQSKHFEGKKKGHQCHPYDLCAVLVAEEAGVIITDIYGAKLNAPLDTTSNVDWIGYANSAIQKQVEPALQRVLKTFELTH